MQRSAIETFLRNLHTTVALQPSSPDELASLPALDRLTSFIEEHEKLKYPASAFMYSTKKNTFNNEDLIVTHIIKNADDSYPTEEQLKEISQESLKIRKLSLIAGIVNMLNQSSNFLNINDAGEKNRLIDNLMVLATNIHEKTNKDIKLSLEANMEKFINSLISTVMETSKLDKENVLRQIRNTERYYVAMKNRRRAIVCEYYDKNINAIIQTDIPFNNKLSVEQKNEFMEIYHKPPLEIPAWFTALPKWEQDWLKRHIPKNINDSWDEFESIFQSSAMQHIPGVKNGRFNYLVKKNINNDEYDILSSSSKTASLVPYEMPNSTKATEQNAEHLHGILLEKAKDNFKDKWGNILLSPPPVLILFQSLLSNTLFGATDKVLHNLQKEAINKLRARNTKATVIFGNLAVNILRHLPGEETSYITQIIRIADEFLNSLSQSTKPLDFKQIKRLRLIKCALKNLREMEASMPSGLLRNDAAFKAAYVGILVEEMGGIVSTNCKSGKDRTGLDEIYRHAMRLYFEDNYDEKNTKEDYNELPNYNVSDQKFETIYKDLFNSMKAQESAAMNTPGAFGLNDEAKMLSGSITTKLGKAYSLSSARAKMNKPSSFKEDEADQADEIAGKRKPIGREVVPRIPTEAPPLPSSEKKPSPVAQAMEDVLHPGASDVKKPSSAIPADLQDLLKGLIKTAREVRLSAQLLSTQLDVCTQDVTERLKSIKHRGPDGRPL